MNQLLKKYPQEIQQIKAKYPADQPAAALMPLIYLAQREGGVVTRQAILDIVEISGVSFTEIESVIGFYTLFHEEGGRYRLQVCNDLPCALRGADEFLKNLCENIGIRLGETTPDGLFTIEAVTCLAGCNHAPVLQVQGDGELTYQEDMTVEKTVEVMEKLRARANSGGEGS